MHWVFIFCVSCVKGSRRVKNCGTKLIWNSNGSCRDGKGMLDRLDWGCRKADAVPFTTLTCAVQADDSADRDPALSPATRQVSVITPRSPRGDANPPSAQALFPSLSSGAPQHRRRPRASAGSPGCAGFASPPVTHTTADLTHRGITETGGWETQFYSHLEDFGFFFTNLLFKPSRNIHKAHTIQIVYYYF